MDEPRLRAYILESAPPQTHYESREGRWVGVAEWPSPSTEPRTLFLTDGGLSEEQHDLSATAVPYNLAVGQFGGDWGAVAMPHEQAPDQRYDDSLSLCFDGDPLTEPLEILGAGCLRVRISSDRPSAMLSVRLNDVRPDGSVTKVTMGMLNLAHHAGSEFPEPLEEETCMK